MSGIFVGGFWSVPPIIFSFLNRFSIGKKARGAFNAGNDFSFSFLTFMCVMAHAEKKEVSKCVLHSHTIGAIIGSIM